MNFLRGMALSVAVLVGVSISARAADQTLYQRLGEQPGISYIVDTTVGKIASDARINKYFAHTNIPHLKYDLVQYIGQASGGPQKYTGRSMTDAHKGMHITKAAFDAMVEDFTWGLNKTGVGAQEQKQFMAKLAALESKIVEAPAPTPAPTTGKHSKGSAAKAKVQTDPNQ